MVEQGKGTSTTSAGSVWEPPQMLLQLPAGSTPATAIALVGEKKGGCIAQTAYKRSEVIICQITKNVNR